jgi:hypothetical protein
LRQFKNHHVEGTTMSPLPESIPANVPESTPTTLRHEDNQQVNATTAQSDRRPRQTQHQGVKDASIAIALDGHSSSLQDRPQLDQNSQQILEKALANHLKDAAAQNVRLKEEARFRRAYEAWRRLAAFRGEAIPDDLRGDALWGRLAELIVEMGQVLKEDGWGPNVEAVIPDSDAKTYALNILKRAMEGNVDVVEIMVKKSLQSLWELGLPADSWLREGLMYCVLKINPPPDPPVGWEGVYDEPIENVNDFVRWIDQQLVLHAVFAQARSHRESDGRLVRNAFRIVAKLELKAMPYEPVGPFTLHTELAVLRNLRRSCLELVDSVEASVDVETESVSDAKATTRNADHKKRNGRKQIVGETAEDLIRRLLAKHSPSSLDEMANLSGLSQFTILRLQGWKDYEEACLADYLAAHPEAVGRDVRRDLGFSRSKASGMRAWKSHCERRKSAKNQCKLSARPLTKAMEDCRADANAPDPSDRITSREQLFRGIIECADPDLRGRLNKLAPTEQEALLDHTLKSIDMPMADSDQTKNQQIVLEVVRSWLEGHEQEKRHQNRRTQSN